ncbi:putative mismatched base pair and cruciform dna recognition protein [Phaeoacremonium minimum UCRPA7]|uniref:Putative mismatched base pair and cruciform dna recognition protein n=1 Tax=Phaeoacremonium minimum (strain UCR-PA7) TaxID=1286976 RepID=R8BTL8_PHAM7|nr:putative mismatched base pair and cruciform dna recognition protein [Phaeoacremonium minimum UCRPA7]EOO02712.1 putative mismatched base pair and cruciform dna recognition protein [Phaeoacremonium minimum UCRPA7]
MSSNDNTSTLKSYVDSATGAVQNALGSIIGSNGDQAQGAAKQDKAQAEYDASHATAKLPGFTASSSGAVTKDDPDRAAGSWNQTVGAGKETLGGLVGSENLKQQGRQQNLEGQQQEAKGQVNDFASGAADRVTGTVGGAVAGLTGNKGAEAEYQRQHDEGKTTQRGAEHDIQKQNEVGSQ